jgi:hypothetical protein
MAASTGINGVLLTNISEINRVIVTGTGTKNVAGAILSFGGVSATTTTTTAGTSGTGGGGGGIAYAVKLFGDPNGKPGGGFEDPAEACVVGPMIGFPANNGNDLYLNGFDSNLGQVTVFFDVGLTTPFPVLLDSSYYYVESRSEPHLDRTTVLSQQGTSDGWVYLNGPCE